MTLARDEEPAGLPLFGAAAQKSGSDLHSIGAFTTFNLKYQGFPHGYTRFITMVNNRRLFASGRLRGIAPRTI